MAELQIKIGADVTSAVQGLNQVGTELEQTSRDANAFSNSVDKASAKLRALPNVTGQATSTLTNFSRVVQDAPYGIIGIANNIDPLVQSFNQLKVSTGSTTGAFKALISQLAGPAGIALGISLVTSLLVKYSDKLFGASEASKQLAAQTKAAAEAQKQIITQLGQERTEVDKLVLLINNENTTRGQKEAILKKLQQISPQYFGDLRVEAGLVTNLSAAYQKYLQSLVARSEVAVLTKQLEDISVAILELERQGANTEVIDLGLKQGLDGRLQATKLLTKEQVAQLTLNTQLAAEERKRQAILDQIAQKQGALTDDLKIRAKSVKVEPVGKLDFSSFLSQGFDLPTQFSDEVKQAGRSTGDLYGIEFNNTLKKAATGINETLFNIDATKLLEFITSVRLLGEQTANAFNEGFKDLAAGSISSIAEGLGQVFAGGDIQNSFQAFAATIGGGLQAIGKQLVAIGTTALLAKEALKSLFTNPAAAIAAGVALIAAGSALQNALSKGLPGRAAGGPVSGNSPYLVGERGPELFVPATSGKIVPNHEVGSFSGGLASMLGMSGRGGTTLRGQDILLAYARTQRSQLRVNG